MRHTTPHLTTLFADSPESLPSNLPETPHCSIQGRIRSIETHNNVMTVFLKLRGRISGDVYQFSTRNPIFQAQLLAADLGKYEVLIEGKALLVPTRVYPRNGGTILSLKILNESSNKAK